MPPYGWEKYKNEFSFYKNFEQTHAEVSWDGLEMKWICTLTRNRLVITKEMFQFSYDAFNFPMKYLEQE